MHNIQFFVARRRMPLVQIQRVVRRLVPGIGVLLVAIGCGVKIDGPPRAAVSGNVTLGGEPLRSGVIRFVPIEGTKGPAILTQILNGYYTTSRIDGPVLGTHRVEIDADFDDDPVEDANDPEEARTEYIRRNGPIATVQIPEIYNRKSTLRAVIEADEDNSYDFELASRTE
jgi:hypothetical protein